DRPLRARRARTERAAAESARCEQGSELFLARNLGRSTLAYLVPDRRHAKERGAREGPRAALACLRQEGQYRHLFHRRASIHRIRSEEHTSELQSRENLVCRLLLEKKKI